MKFIAEYNIYGFKYWLQVTPDNRLQLNGLINNAAKFPTLDHCRNYAWIMNPKNRNKMFVIKEVIN